MEIHMIIYDGKIEKGHNGGSYVKPTKLQFKGNYALEATVLKLLEIYYGVAIKDAVENLLKNRIGDDH